MRSSLQAIARTELLHADLPQAGQSSSALCSAPQRFCSGALERRITSPLVPPHPHPPRRYDLWTHRITRVRDGAADMDSFASCDSLPNADQSALDGVLSLTNLKGI
jgi:hypothetical protein